MKFETNVKVRFCETDALGHLNNVSYFIYLEEARVEFFKALNPDMTIENWNIILASTSCDFIKQVYFDEILSIETSVEKIGTSSFHIVHEVFNPAKEVVARGRAAVVHFDFHSQTTEPLPDFMKERLNKYYQEKISSN
ncbi:thioesterase superfamily protein [Alkalihalophilus pseudofirmus OF4]|uniref:Thioesterase superfamily protein n=1 Tax=Alkalihalophilus pseudofirmus (strain ATCC BAA-2126 / JCM 17055 / OF4) TaxID=398511 RepID=D3FRI2_ALKPO|nr:acyl-CoA thioesterase [Alkalihalophilus pseudofirmus]ADC51573.1 thioesterase superfamily protein [Alkalihalophilus pseudofirmus OF4]